jgi:hypothetical protein
MSQVLHRDGEAPSPRPSGGSNTSHTLGMALKNFCGANVDATQISPDMMNLKENTNTAAFAHNAHQCLATNAPAGMPVMARSNSGHSHGLVPAGHSVVAETAKRLLQAQQAQQQREQLLEQQQRNLSLQLVIQQQQVLQSRHFREQAQLEQLLVQQHQYQQPPVQLQPQAPVHLVNEKQHLLSLMTELQRERELREKAELALEEHKESQSRSRGLDTKLDTRDLEISLADSGATMPCDDSTAESSVVSSMVSSMVNNQEADLPLDLRLSAEDEVELAGILDMDWAQIETDELMDGIGSQGDAFTETGSAFAEGFPRQVMDHEGTGESHWDVVGRSRSLSSPLSSSTKIPIRKKIQKPSVKKAAAGSDEKAVEVEFQCGYCNAIKGSMSTGGDGHVRIRCKCGGKHGDGKMRMHARWKMLGPVRQINTSSTEPLSLERPASTESGPIDQDSGSDVTRSDGRK